MYKLYSLFLTLSLLSFSAHSQTEDWYFALNAGFASNSNPATVESVISSAESIYGTTRISISADIGVYWPALHESLLIGVVSNSSSDSVNSAFGGNIITHTASHIGGSALYYLGPKVGEGLFVRGDFGFAQSRYRVLDSTFVVDNGNGTALLAGVGYSLPMSEESRLVFSLNVVNRQIEGESHTSTQLMIGGLW